MRRKIFPTLGQEVRITNVLQCVDCDAIELLRESETPTPIVRLFQNERLIYRGLQILYVEETDRLFKRTKRCTPKINAGRLVVMKMTNHFFASTTRAFKGWGVPIGTAPFLEIIACVSTNRCVSLYQNKRLFSRIVLQF